MPPNPSGKSFVGVGKEVTKGTAIAASDFIPITAPAKPKRDIDQLMDKSLRGAPGENYNLVQGVWVANVDLEGDVFADSIGVMVKAIMGEEVLTGAGAPYVHAFDLLNSGDTQPPSWTIYDNYGVACRAYPGGQCSEVMFSWDESTLLKWTAKWQSKAESVVSAPTPSFTTLLPMAGWQVTLTIGGVQAFASSGEFNLKRPVKPVHVGDGSQDPKYLWAGKLAVDGKMKLLMEADTYYTAFLTNAQFIISLTFTRGAGAALEEVTFVISKASWRTSIIDRSEEWVQLDCVWQGLLNSTDAGPSGGYSPGKITVKNARSTVY